MSLFLLGSGINAFAQQRLDEKTSAVVDGIVFLDANQNGFQEGLEEGVGGVTIYYGDEQFVVSDKEGRFKFEFEMKREIERVEADVNSIPPGSAFSTPSRFQVSQKLGIKRTFAFGVSYEPKSTQLQSGEVIVEATTDPGKKDFTIEVVDQDIFIDGEKIDESLEGAKVDLMEAKPDQTFVVGFDELPIKFYENQYFPMLRHLQTYKNFLKSVEIQIRLPSEKSDLRKAVADELWLKLVEQGIDRDLLKIKQVNGPKELKVVVGQGSIVESCDLKVGTDRYSLKVGKNNIPMETLPNVRALLECPQGSASFISPWRKVNAEPAPETLRDDPYLIASPFIEYSQDLNLFFTVKSNADKVSVNGDPVLPSSRGIYKYVYAGKTGLNNIQIIEEGPGNKRNIYDKEFKLFSPPKFHLLTMFKQLNQESTSDVFATNYDIAKISQLEVEFGYTFNSNWELIVSYSSDIQSNEVRSVTNQNIATRHIDYSVLYGKTFRINPEKFHSNTYSLYGGYSFRSFNPGNLGVIFYAKDMSGVTIRSDFMVREMLPQTMDIRLIAEGIFDVTDLSNQVYKFQANGYLWLNRLGKLFGITPDFIYYERYGPLHNLKLVAGLGIEYSIVETDNFATSKTKDQYLLLNLGLEYKF